MSIHQSKKRKNFKVGELVMVTYKTKNRLGKIVDVEQRYYNPSDFVIPAGAKAGDRYGDLVTVRWFKDFTLTNTQDVWDEAWVCRLSDFVAEQEAYLKKLKALNRVSKGNAKTKR